MKFLKITLLTVLLISIQSYAQNLNLSPYSKVSILTCGSGDEMYSLFGHTALRIKDEKINLDVVYNYGTFDFNTSNFYLKFFKGDLQYMATACSFEEFIQEYIYEQRYVKEQVLNLNLVQKQVLFDKLNNVLQSNDRYYTYKFIDRNCTTMVVDAINNVTGSKTIDLKERNKKTYRQILYPFFQNHFFENLGISILFGTKVDAFENHIFLPEVLFENLKKSQINNSKFCNETQYILNFKPVQNVKSWWNNYTFLLIVFIALIIINKIRVYQYYLMLCGTLGLFMFFAMFYSLHRELSWNYNILLFNPLYVLLILPKSEYLIKTRIYLCKVCLFLVGIYILFAWNKIHFIAILPFIGLTIIGLYKIKNWNKKATDHDKITRY